MYILNLKIYKIKWIIDNKNNDDEVDDTRKSTISSLIFNDYNAYNLSLKFVLTLVGYNDYEDLNYLICCDDNTVNVYDY